MIHRSTSALDFFFFQTNSSTQCRGVALQKFNHQFKLKAAKTALNLPFQGSSLETYDSPAYAWVSCQPP